jgi:VIT1/CCC1 family predicted Fe2+/Mn2+ transporter
MTWADLLGNVHLVLLTISSLVTIIGGIAAALRYARRRRVSLPARSSVVVYHLPVPALAPVPHLHPLDLSQKLLAAGKGLLHGALCGGIAFCCGVLVLGALVLFCSAQLSRILPNPAVVFTLVCLLAGALGTVVGLVAGVNRAKQEGYALMLHYRALR